MDPQQPQPQPTSPNPARKPIAYDVNAQPIYAEDQVRPSHVTAAPQVAPGENYDPRIRAQYANEPGVVHAVREVVPQPFTISEEAKLRTERSRRRYPHLNLSDGEYVILAIRRHPIGLLMPLLAGGFILLVLLAVMIIYPGDTENTVLPSFGVAALTMMLLMALVGVGTAITVWVYLQNQFYLTNESVVQEIQHSLFARNEQTVSLGSIEDASFEQHGIVQTLLNYGSLRLSTEGDETTYQFQYVAEPRDQIARINNAIEDFKNGRPVGDDIN